MNFSRVLQCHRIQHVRNACSRNASLNWQNWENIFHFYYVLYLYWQKKSEEKIKNVTSKTLLRILNNVILEFPIYPKNSKFKNCKIRKFNRLLAFWSFYQYQLCYILKWQILKIVFPNFNRRNTKLNLVLRTRWYKTGI